MKKFFNINLILGVILTFSSPIIYLLSNKNIDYAWYFGVFIYFVFLLILFIGGLVNLIIGFGNVYPTFKTITRKIVLSAPFQLIIWLSTGFIFGILNDSIFPSLFVGFMIFLLRKRIY